MAFWQSIRGTLFAVAAVGGFVAGAQPKGLEALYEAVYPSDPAKREALAMCFAEDHTFNRLSPTAREACYRGALASVDPPAGRTAVQPPQVNAVDLARAAGQGRMPRNDVRREEETRAMLHVAQ